MDDVIIIGGGPAGLAAAVQLKRFGLEPRIFEPLGAGGLLWNAHRVENYPGFPGGVSGPDLARLIAAHAESAGVRLSPERVVELAWDEGRFRVTTAAGAYSSRFAVVASGTKPRVLTDFGIPDPIRTKVVYEIRSLSDVEGARIIIVGGGDAAFDYALNVGKNNAVVILNRGGDVKCLPLLYERAMACPKIRYVTNAVVRAVSVAPEGALSVQCSGPGGGFTLGAEYIIGAVGRDPCADFISERLVERMPDLERRGVLHFAGDVKNGMCRQTAVAVGDGVMAAVRVHRALKGNRERK